MDVFTEYLHLKQCGLAFMMYAQDYDGRIAVAVKGSPTPNWDRWIELLYQDRSGQVYGYITNPDVAVCPSYPPNTYDFSLSWGCGRYFTYGIVCDPNYSQYAGNLKVVWAPPLFHWLHLYKLPTPLNCIFLIDSVAQGGSGTPGLGNQYCLIESISGQRIHLRHTGLANALFADGHVEAVGKTRLAECGFTGAREKDGTYVTW